MGSTLQDIIYFILFPCMKMKIVRAGFHHCHFATFHCLSKKLALQVLRLTNSHQLL